MDFGSIAKDTLSGVLSTLAVMMLVNLGKQILARLKQRKKQPKEVLLETLRTTEEYQEILRNRRTQLLFGYLALFGLLVYTALIIFLIVSTKTIGFFFRFENLGLFLSLLCEVPLGLYVGYSPVTTNEVEQKRQANRMRKLKEARGAVPLQYIFQEIVFPILFWLFFIFCIIGFILMLTSPPPYVHLPFPVVLVGC